MDTFDAWSRLSSAQVRRLYEARNDIRTFLELKAQLPVRSMVDIGCATGEHFRYFSQFHPEIKYLGLDISEGAIQRAGDKFGAEHFRLIQPDRTASEQLREMNYAPDMVWCRNVTLHQTKPFDFLRDLLSIPCRFMVAEIRTRDVGATELDPDISCQEVYGAWVPYMVLNTDEVLELVKQTTAFDRLIMVKNLIILGGTARRYLPKDLYLKATRGAMTTLAVVHAIGGGQGQVDIRERQEPTQEEALKAPWRTSAESFLARARGKLAYEWGKLTGRG